MMDVPLVSVVMPVYGVEKYVGAAIHSVLTQTLPSFELIVVDDRTPDDSMAVVRSFDDHRIRIIRHRHNLGLAAARNTGIANARGQFIALLDSDDVSPPLRLATQVAALQADTTLLGCGGRMQYMNPEGLLYGPVHQSEADPARIAPTLLFRNAFFVSSMMFRRRVFETLRYRTDFPMAEDFELMVRASRIGALRNLPDLLLHYRVHASSLTSTKPRLMDECRRRIAVEQLQRFGVEPTTTELDTHMRVALPSSSATREQVNEVFVWLKRLAQLNQSRRVYPTQAFNDVLASSWFEVCTLASGLGPWVIARYLRQGLAGTAGVAPVRWLRFAAKSALGLERAAQQR
jgi:GT2 family glycosyltransferase